MYAVRAGHHEVLVAWMATGAVAINRPNKHGWTASTYAARVGNNIYLDTMLAHDDIDADWRDRSKRTPLCHAMGPTALSLAADTKTVQILLFHEG